MLFCCLLIFFKINFSKNYFWNTIRVSNSLDPADLDQHCLQAGFLCLVLTKPVFEVSNKASFKPVCSATGTSYKIEISLHMGLSTKQITKALIRLRGCAGWSAPVLFANPRRRVFSRRGSCGPIMVNPKVLRQINCLSSE